MGVIVVLDSVHTKLQHSVLFTKRDTGIADVIIVTTYEITKEPDVQVHITPTASHKSGDLRRFCKKSVGGTPEKRGTSDRFSGNVPEVYSEREYDTGVYV